MNKPSSPLPAAAGKSSPLRIFIRQLMVVFEPRERFRLALQLLLMIGGGMAELIGVLLIPILVMILSAPDMLNERIKSHHLDTLLPAGGLFGSLPWFVAFLAVFFILKNAYLSFIIWSQTRLMVGIQFQLYRRLLTSYLRAPYSLHLRESSGSHAHVLISDLPRVFFQILIPLFSIVTEFFVFVSLSVLLAIVNLYSFFIAIFIIGGASLGFYMLQRSHIRGWNRDQEKHGPGLLRIFNQSLGGIKEIKVLGREDNFLKLFSEHALVYVRAMRQTQAASSYPKYFIESVAMLAIAIMIGFMAWRGQAGESILQQIALFAAAAIRLAPSLNRMVAAANSLLGNRSALQTVTRDLAYFKAGTSHREKKAPESFREEVVFEAVDFAYEGTEKSALKKASFSIPRGSSVALVGHSGAGKSTVADIFLGLLTPTQGRVLMDGRDIQDFLHGWQRKIGYIPQAIYLADDSIRRNIAFGIPDAEIDDTGVWEAAEAAQLRELIADLPHGLDQQVGERGIRLSGGQRQRIAIARALYHRPEILVMDEATSALDNQTEKEITSVINRFQGRKTILIIAHRLSTVRHCDQLIFLQKGEILGRGPYKRLLEICPEFRAMEKAG